MRPIELAPLFAPVDDLPGVGPKVSEQLSQLCGPHVLDLVWHRPLRFIDRRLRDSLVEVQSGETVSLKLTIGKHRTPARKGLPYKISCLHSETAITLLFFHARGSWLSEQFPEGAQRIVSGKAEFYKNTWQMIHPDLSLPPEKFSNLPDFEPVYPNRSGLGQRTLGNTIRSAVGRLKSMDEWIDPALKHQRKWPDFQSAIRSIHSDQDASNIPERLAYDEALAGQVALGVLRANHIAASGPNLSAQGKLRKTLVDSLPFPLTSHQVNAIDTLTTQIRGPKQAITLIQGDVGSGKTLVALCTILQAVESGHQGVLMAPTEILARQHANTLTNLTEKLSVNVVCLTGKDKGVKRTEIREQIATGQADIVVGTHALFQEGIEFQSAGLVVIDEQHRFGVQQRLALSKKGQTPHLLLMSATPIPRTLVMAAYGDLELLEIREKPVGRAPIKTIAKPKESIPEVYRSLERLLDTGQQAYWICPLVEESESLPGVADATTRFTDLQKRFGDQVGLIHGQMRADEKDEIMRLFKAGSIKLLAATTVIEVGVDVPNSTFMVIEQAERFGLSQLHQIRGRVGRGALPGVCLLLYGHPLSALAKQRLEALRSSDDGFELSEQDLRLRGGGEILGTKQSGLPDTKFLDYGLHTDLMSVAKKDARKFLSEDPNLTSARGLAMRNLLYLFGKDEAAPLLKIG